MTINIDAVLLKMLHCGNPALEERSQLFIDERALGQSVRRSGDPTLLRRFTQWLDMCNGMCVDLFVLRDVDQRIGGPNLKAFFKAFYDLDYLTLTQENRAEVNAIISQW